MKEHLIAELQKLPEDDLAKILNWALFQAQRLDDPSSWEYEVKNRIYSLIWQLEREK